MDNLIITNLNKSYKNFNLKDVNIALPANNIMGFVGENGAGKSTTIKSILELVNKDSGEVLFFGKKLDNAARQNIGVVMEECCFPTTLNIRQINSFLKDIYKNWEENTFYGYIEKFKLPLKKNVKEFSKGMKMQLSIAVALSHKAKLLILDEATSGLDPFIRNEILDLFLEFVSKDENSIFMSSHIISDLEKVCDSITFIHNGNILLSKNKKDLVDNYGFLLVENEDKLNQINKEYIYKIKKSKYGYELMVNKKEIKEAKDLTLEEIVTSLVERN